MYDFFRSRSAVMLPRFLLSYAVLGRSRSFPIFVAVTGAAVTGGAGLAAE